MNKSIDILDHRALNALRSTTAVFFDYDGTLVEGGINLRSIKEAMVETSGRSLFPSEIKFLEKHWRRTDTHLQGVLIRPICDRLGVTTQAVVQIYEVIRLRHYVEPTFMDGAVAALNAGEKFSVTGLVTNQNSAVGRLAVAANLPETDRSIASFMNLVVYQGDLGTHKPNPIGYMAAVELAQRSPSECLAIEDTTRGVQAAKKAGIPVVLVGVGFEKRALEFVDEDATPDFVAHSLDSVTTALDQILRLYHVKQRRSAVFPRRAGSYDGPDVEV